MSHDTLPVIMVVDPDLMRRHEIAELVQGWHRTSFRVLQSGELAELAPALRLLSERRVPIAAVIVTDGSAVESLAAQHPEVRWLLLPGEGRVLADDGFAERLRADLDDALISWNAEAGGGLATAEVRGRRFSPSAYDVRDFLGRSGVIFRWMPDEDAPVTVRLGDGTELVEPPISELAQRLGLIRPAARDRYDVAVVGGGPGGLSTAVYAAAEGMSVVVIEDDCPGGQAGSTSRIENYLGFPVGLTGGDLARRALQQARRARVEWQPTRVATRLTPANGGGADGHSDHTVEFVKAGTAEAHAVSAAAVVIATGVEWNRLAAPGVDRLLNSGV